MSENEKKARLALVAETVDRLITVDVSARGMMGLLYSAARENQREPLAMAAARRLVEAIEPGNVVIIGTGMLIHPFRDLGETDGPVGGAGLARALQLGLGAKPVFVTEERLVGMLAATVRAAGLNVMPLERLKALDLATSVVTFPTRDKEAVVSAREMLHDLSPKAIIAIERRGPNRKGVYHAIGGRDMAPEEARVGRLFDQAREQRILTIGIGDGGNEIGFGAIRTVVEDKVPLGTRCTCPCEGGILDNTTVDVLIACAVSNWGAYGIEACLAALLDRPELLHSEADEARMMRECADAGAIDGITCLPEIKADGMPVEVHAAVIRLLHEVIRAPAFGHPRKVHLK